MRSAQRDEARGEIDSMRFDVRRVHWRVVIGSHRFSHCVCADLGVKQSALAADRAQSTIAIPEAEAAHA
ncbi:MAG: hypothetical protein JST84_20760 [Acidobacteria bacterium]|nr:hypothetical protein [Acidobacteriota bacterium]